MNDDSGTDHGSVSVRHAYGNSTESESCSEEPRMTVAFSGCTVSPDLTQGSGSGIYRTCLFR